MPTTVLLKPKLAKLSVVITTLDDEGESVGNTPVIFKRGDSIGRRTVVNTSTAAAIQINHSES